MNRLQAFWEVSWENQSLLVGYLVFAIVLLAICWKSAKKPWAHVAVFLAYSCWTFGGLLWKGGYGASLVYLFYGAVLLLLHGVVLVIRWRIHARQASSHRMMA